jgi:hypothetical protein
MVCYRRRDANRKFCVKRSKPSVPWKRRLWHQIRSFLLSSQSKQLWKQSLLSYRMRSRVRLHSCASCVGAIAHIWLKVSSAQLGMHPAQMHAAAHIEGMRNLRRRIQNSRNCTSDIVQFLRKNRLYSQMRETKSLRSSRQQMPKIQNWKNSYQLHKSVQMSLRCQLLSIE